MKYYEFVIENLENILITLDIKSGEADLYLGKGIGKLPTKNNYYQKSATYKGDQIEIKTTDFENELEMIDVYTIGVYSRVYSSYSLMYSPNFGNIYHLKY